MLKRVLENLDGLEETLKALYLERNGKFYLQVEDDAETGALRRAKDREAEAARVLRTEKAALESKVEDLETQLSTASLGRKKPDELERAWETKYNSKVTELTAVIAGKDKTITELVGGSAADNLANKIFISGIAGTIGKKVISERLRVEYENGEPRLRVLDAAGELSAMTLAELEREFVDKPEFASIVKGSNASGSGAVGAGKGSGGAGPKPHEMTGAERLAFQQTNPAGFQDAVKRGLFNPPKS